MLLTNALSICALLFILHRRCTGQGEFSTLDYPVNSQPCVNQAFKDSGCPEYAATQQDVCRCPCANKGDFVDNTAKCVYKSDFSDIAQVWNYMLGACALAGLSLDYSESKFLNGGQAPAASSPSIPHGGASSTPGYNSGPTPSSPATNSNSGGGLSSSSSDNSGGGVAGLSGGMIALVSCVATVGSLIATLVMCCCPCGGHNRVERWSRERWPRDRWQHRGHPEYRTYSEPRGPWSNTGYY